MKKILIAAGVLLVVVVFGMVNFKYIKSLHSEMAALQSKTSMLEGKTIDGQLLDIREEHKALQDLKAAFIKAGGDERMKWLENRSNTLQMIQNNTGAVVPTTGGSIEGIGTSF